VQEQEQQEARSKRKSFSSNEAKRRRFCCYFYYCKGEKNSLSLFPFIRLNFVGQTFVLKKRRNLFFFCKPVLVQKELHRNHIFFIKVQIEITFFCCLIEIIRSKRFYSVSKRDCYCISTDTFKILFLFCFYCQKFFINPNTETFSFPFLCLHPQSVLCMTDWLVFLFSSSHASR
jgi:hypothetical protein